MFVCFNEPVSEFVSESISQSVSQSLDEMCSVYQVYKRSSKNSDHESSVLDRASDDVRNATSNQHDKFSAQVVIIVTWYNVMEAPCSEHSQVSK